MAADSASLRVYVGNLSWGVDSELLAPHMAAAGTVQNADVMMRRDGKSKGCAIVTYSTAEEAQNAVETLTDTELDGRKIFVRADREPLGATKKPASLRRERAPRERAPRKAAAPSEAAPANSTPGTQLYVGNLPWSAQWSDLKDLFADHGCVYADVVVGRDGRSRGYGIVRFDTVEQAQAAIAEFNEYDFNGRPIVVREDRPRE